MRKSPSNAPSAPEFMEHWRNVSAHALRTQRALSRKVKELICVVTDALTYFEPGFRRHVKAALEEGATEQEVFKVIELCSVSGVQYIYRHLGILQ